MPTIVGQEVPASGSEGWAVGLAWAIGLLVGVAVGLAVGLPVGVAVGVPVGVGVGLLDGVGVGVELPVGVGVGEPDGVVNVNVRAVQASGTAALGLDSGAVGATACCLSW